MRKNLRNELHLIAHRGAFAEAAPVYLTSSDARALMDAVDALEWASERICILTAELHASQKERAALLFATGADAQLSLPTGDGETACLYYVVLPSGDDSGWCETLAAVNALRAQSGEPEHTMPVERHYLGTMRAAVLHRLARQRSVAAGVRAVALAELRRRGVEE